MAWKRLSVSATARVFRKRLFDISSLFSAARKRNRLQVGKLSGRTEGFEEKSDVFVTSVRLLIRRNRERRQRA
jgi:hypothetical protein